MVGITMTHDNDTESSSYMYLAAVYCLNTL